MCDEDWSEEEYLVCEIVIQHQQYICRATEDKLHADRIKLKFICKSISPILVLLALLTFCLYVSPKNFDVWMTVVIQI